MKRSHKNNRARTTARERVHRRWINGPDSRCWLTDVDRHTPICDAVTRLLETHVTAALARRRGRGGQ